MLDRVLSAVVLCGAFLILTVVGGYAAPKTISKPMFNGNRLDWCLKWSTDCGKPAADAFCKAQGYQTAITYEPERRIGAKTPTRLIGTGATCDLPYCDGFRQITCETTPIAKQVTSKKDSAVDAPLPLVRASYAPPLPQAKPAREVAQATTGTSGKTKDAAKAEAKEVATADVEEESSEPDPVATGSVVAATPLPAPKMFEKPMYNGKRLDWCHGWDKDCGQVAADAFCKTNGFSRAKEFAQDPHIGDTQPTRIIANGAVCDQAVCNGFKAITCTM